MALIRSTPSGMLSMLAAGILPAAAKSTALGHITRHAADETHERAIFTFILHPRACRAAPNSEGVTRQRQFTG